MAVLGKEIGAASDFHLAFDGGEAVAGYQEGGEEGCGGVQNG